MACIFYDMPYVIFRHAEETEISPVLHVGKRVRSDETVMLFLRKQLFELFQCFHGILGYKCLPLQSFLTCLRRTLQTRREALAKTKEQEENEQ